MPSAASNGTVVECKAFESYKVLRNYAEHEGTLLNNRVTWLLVSNAFLFASVGFAVRELADSGNEILRFFVLISAIAGFSISLASYLSILASYKASNSLKLAWEAYSENLTAPDSGANVYFVAPFAGGGNVWASIAGSYAALVLPILLGIMWAAVFHYFYTMSQEVCNASLDLAGYRSCVVLKLQEIVDVLEAIRSSPYFMGD